MWLRFSKNSKDITTEMEATKHELREIAEGTDNFQQLMANGLKAAMAVWEKYPEFKQVTVDTFSKEELDMMEQAARGKGGAA